MPSLDRSLLPDTPSFLAMVLVLAIVLLVFLLALTGKTDTDVFKVLVGALMSVGFTNIVGFYFGSSSGSKEKDDMRNQSFTKLVDKVVSNGTDGPKT